MVKKEDISESTLKLALRRAKEDVDSAKAFVRSNPVCSKCEKSQLKGEDVECLKWSDGIRCSRCRAKKVGCPRLVDFWIAHIACQLGLSKADVRSLYNRYCRPTRRSRGRSGSRNSKNTVDLRRSLTRGVLEEDEEFEDDDSYVETDEDEASTVDDEEELFVLPAIPKPKIKASGQNSTNASRNVDWTKRGQVAVVYSDSKRELTLLKKENELLKQRAEIAEGNFIALVSRVQDFRTSLRSEIHTKPSVNGLSRLSAAMETTIDDSGLYLRNISDTLKQSRTSWEIQSGVNKAKEGGSKEQRRQTRQRSPEPVQKRRKI